jgi:hypothetical protein
MKKAKRNIAMIQPNIFSSFLSSIISCFVFWVLCFGFRVLGFVFGVPGFGIAGRKFPFRGLGGSAMGFVFWVFLF